MQHQRQTKATQSQGQVTTCHIMTDVGRLWYQCVFNLRMQFVVHKGSVCPIAYRYQRPSCSKKLGIHSPHLLGWHPAAYWYVLVALISTSCSLLTLRPRLLVEKPQTRAGKHIATGLMTHTQLKPCHFDFSTPNYHETSSDIFWYVLLFYLPVSVWMILGSLVWMASENALSVWLPSMTHADWQATVNGTLAASSCVMCPLPSKSKVSKMVCSSGRAALILSSKRWNIVEQITKIPSICKSYTIGT